MTPLELGASAFIFALLSPLIIGIVLAADLIESKRLLCRIIHRWEMTNSDGKYEYQQCQRCLKDRVAIHRHA